jgi:fused signal recognition particle receptor
VFGFLKKKLKDAVSRFSKKAKEEAVEEEVTEEAVIEEAKEEEKELLKEEEEKKVEEIPLTDDEKEQIEKEKKAKKAAAKAPKKQKTPEKPTTQETSKKSETKKSKKSEKVSEKPVPEESPTEGEAQEPVEVLEKVTKDEVTKDEELAAASEKPSAELPAREVAKNHVAITYFVHGTSTDNEKKVSTGQADVELSELGEQQAKDLKDELLHTFDAIYTSDLKRAVTTAQLCWGKKAKLTQDERLREADYGDFEQHPTIELEAYSEEYDLYKDGFPNGETLKEIEERIRDFLNDLYDDQLGKHVAIVGHKFPQLALDVLLKGKTWEEAIADDWRKRGAWQPGWTYTLTEYLGEPDSSEELPRQEVTEESSPEEATESPKQKEEKKGFLSKLFGGKKEEAEPFLEEEPESLPEEIEPEESTPESEEAEPVKPKRGILSRLKETFTKKTLSEEKFEELFWDLEVAMLENNVALEVIEKIKDDLKEELTTGKVSRLGIEDQIMLSLKHSIEEILSVESYDLVEKIKKDPKRPFVIAFIGVNGSGKTTTLAKIANLFQEEGLGVVMAASDTFRAAAIDQLKEHATKLSIKLISQGYGADPAAVAYDAVEHGKAKHVDVVMIDTAGRLHSNTNLMAELEKVVRVAKPDLKIFIGESVTGNDCVEQAKEFDKAVGIDAIILSKADVDEKGGAAISVSHVTGKPILYLGVGQAYGDLKRFDRQKIIKSLGF